MVIGLVWLLSFQGRHIVRRLQIQKFLCSSICLESDTFFIFRGVYFGVNDTLVAINPYQKKKDLTALASKFSVAQFASSSASFVGYPLGLVCARLKLQCDAPPAERLYRNALHCFNEIVAREGVRGLWKGFGASWMSQIGSAIALVTYGEVKALLFKKR